MMFNLFKCKKESKAQGAIEYLLIIGAAILIAAIVVTILISTTKKTKGSVDQVYGDFNSIIGNVDYGIDAPCDDNCLMEKFKTCEPVKNKVDTEGFNVEILGEDGDYCKTYFVWVEDGKVTDKDMTCWLNTDKNIVSALEEAADIESADEKPLCEGPYYD